MSNLPTWVFDESPIDDPFGYGDRAVRFLRQLKHPKSKLDGFQFQLDPWQERIVRRIYGPRHADGRRIVRTVSMMLPRGNRKTSLGAALALLHTIGPENTPRAENIVAASDRSQARIAYEEAYSIVKTISALDGKLRLTDSKNRIANAKTAAWFEALSADGRVAHGHTPAFALVDEIHAWPKRDLWEAITSGLIKVPNSLLMVISTAGRGTENVAWTHFDYARKVARGEVQDETLLPILFETDRDADWLDEDVWRRVNPGMAYGYPDLHGMRVLAKQAKESPSERASFQQLVLNMWLDGAADPFVDMMIYDEGAVEIDLDDLEGAPCWIGVDLSATNDLTCVVACFREGGDGFQVVPFFFCPEEQLRARSDRDRVPYVEWAEEGFITATPGTVVDLHAVEAQIRELCARFEVREIAFDPHMARTMISDLLDDGLPAVEMRQGWVTMAPAIKDLERAILGRRFRHGGHPVLRWNFENIAVRVDPAGNKGFHKGKSREKIDGAVAAAMALSRCAAGDSGISIYDRADDWSDEHAFF